MAGTKSPQSQHSVSSEKQSSTHVTGRKVVSEPLRVIQVERVRVSDEQRSSVASAIRSGRESRDSSS
jgi:hypothetical protein